eukprot:755529-Hanusia_phi.AAC.8
MELWPENEELMLRGQTGGDLQQDGGRGVVPAQASRRSLQRDGWGDVDTGALAKWSPAGVKEGTKVGNWRGGAGGL